MSKAEKKKMSQKKQMIIMVAVLALCAVLVTWTVLLLKDRFGQDPTNEQNSQFDIAQVSSEAETTAPVTQISGLGMWEDVLSGSETIPTRKTISLADITTSATQPVTKKLVTQAAVFIKLTTAKTNATHKKNTTTTAATHKPNGQNGTTAPQQNATTASQHAATHTTPQPNTTHTQTVTQPQTTPAPSSGVTPPSSAQIIYNQLLAAYLGAGAQNGKAYYFEPSANDQPTVVVGNADGYQVVGKAEASDNKDQNAKLITLGGTGSDSPTGADFTFHKNAGGTNYVFYESQGSNHKIMGAFNPNNGDNVWMRVHYTEENGTVSADYHISKKTGSGAAAELSSGTCAADSVYAIPADLSALAAAAGFPAGDLSSLPEVYANAQDDINALRSRAVVYNDGFSLQPGSMYGVINTSGIQVYLRAGMSTASNLIKPLPAGTFVCVDDNYDPDSQGMWCPVSVYTDDTWKSGYVSAVYVLTWKAD